MAEDAVFAEIRRCVAVLCGVEPETIAADAKLLGYGLDSVRLVELLIEIEEKFAVEIDEHDPRVARIETVRHLAELVEKLIAAE